VLNGAAPWLVALIAALAVAGSAAQVATGLGLGLVVAPPVLAALPPAQAVLAVLVAGTLLNVLQLRGRVRAGAIRSGAVATILVAALPGLVAGAWISRHVAKPTLQIAVGVVVVLAVAVRLWHPRARLAGGPARAARIAAGLAAGTLTTSLTTNGPPMALALDAEGASADEFRDTLAILFLTLNLLGAPVLAAATPVDRTVVEAIALLAPCILAGALAGRRVATQLSPVTLRVAALALVITAGAGSVLAGAAG
jgi:uncharacterized membrane protein YfcA